jgi:hypothetical protein
MCYINRSSVQCSGCLVVNPLWELTGAGAWMSSHGWIGRKVCSTYYSNRLSILWTGNPPLTSLSPVKLCYRYGGRIDLRFSEKWVVKRGLGISVCRREESAGSEYTRQFSWVEFILWPMVSRPVRPGIGLPFWAHDQNLSFPFFSDNCFVLPVGRPLWREDGSVV